MVVAAPLALHELMQLFALLPGKGGYSLLEENTPFVSPREGRGAFPSTPDIAGWQLEELRSLRNQVRCTWLRHESSACRFMLQPRPTSWGASDGSLAADCLRIDGFASLAAFWGDGTDSRKHLRGTAALLRSPPRLGFC